MFKNLKVLLGLSLGIITGIALFLFIYLLPLPPNNTLYKILGIQKTQVVGFLPYWLLDRADKDYSPYITTLGYFGLAIDSNGSLIQLTNPREEEPGWHTLKSKTLQEKLSQLSKQNIQTSLLVHIADEATISALISNPKKHAQNLVQDVLPKLKKYNFSDLNLDIESFKEASQSARQNFTQFVKTVKSELKKQSPETSLTIDLSPSILIHSYIIDPVEMGKLADFIVFMTYDYNFVGSAVTGPVAPLGGAGNLREIDVTSSLEKALKVIPREKLLLGIPLYGYEWQTLSDQPFSPTIPGSGAVASTKRVTKILSDCKGCQITTDPVSQEPQVIFPDEKTGVFHQIFYEDKTSLGKKLELAKKYKLRGVALWALGYEDDDMLEPLRNYKLPRTESPRFSAILSLQTCKKT